jgi:iron complex outermembrane receptor protein
LHYDGEAINVESTTAYVNQAVANASNQDYSPLNLESFYANIGGKTFTQEVLVSTKKGSVLNGLFGASYLDDRAFFDGMISGGTGTAFAGLFKKFGAYPYTANTVKSDSSSVFLEGYLTPIGRLKITAGARFTHDSRHLDVTDNAAGSAVARSPILVDQNASTTDNAFTPRVALPRQRDQGDRRGVAAGLGYSQGAGQAVHAGANRPGRHTWAEGDRHR